jgi:hypothetical protein
MNEIRTGEEIAKQRLIREKADHAMRRRKFYEILARRTGRSLEELLAIADEARDAIENEKNEGVTNE